MKWKNNTSRWREERLAFDSSNVVKKNALTNGMCMRLVLCTRREYDFTKLKLWLRLFYNGSMDWNAFLYALICCMCLGLIFFYFILWRARSPHRINAVCMRAPACLCSTSCIQYIVNIYVLNECKPVSWHGYSNGNSDNGGDDNGSSGIESSTKIIYARKLFNLLASNAYSICTQFIVKWKICPTKKIHMTSDSFH